MIIMIVISRTKRQYCLESVKTFLWLEIETYLLWLQQQHT